WYYVDRGRQLHDQHRVLSDGTGTCSWKRDDHGQCGSERFAGGSEREWSQAFRFTCGADLCDDRPGIERSPDHPSYQSLDCCNRAYQFRDQWTERGGLHDLGLHLWPKSGPRRKLYRKRSVPLSHRNVLNREYGHVDHYGQRSNWFGGLNHRTYRIPIVLNLARIGQHLASRSDRFWLR